MAASNSDLRQRLQLRLGRAEEHLDAIREQIRDYSDRRPYEAVIKDETSLHQAVASWDGLPAEAREMHARWTWPVVATEIEPVPDALPLVLGDFLHNLRSVLDHLAWGLVLGHSSLPPWDRTNAPKGFPRLTSFPNVTTRPKPDDRGNPSPTLLQPPTTDAIETVLDRLQPYNTGDPVAEKLARISDLNNRDKHQTLHPTISVLSGGRCVFEFPDGRIIGQRSLGTFVAKSGVLRQQALEPEASLGSLAFSDALPHLQLRPGNVKVDVQAEVVVSLNEGPGTHDSPAQPLVEDLSSLFACVRDDVLPQFDQWL